MGNSGSVFGSDDRKREWRRSGCEFGTGVVDVTMLDQVEGCGIIVQHSSSRRRPDPFHDSSGALEALTSTKHLIRRDRELVDAPSDRILLFHPSTTTLRHQLSKTDIFSRDPTSTKLSDTRLINRSILHPPSTFQPLRPIFRKSEPRILHSMASRVLSLCRLASEIRVRVKQHRQLRTVESTEPWGGSKVGPVTGVLVAVSGEAGLLTQAAGFSSWAEEGGKKADFGKC